MNSNGTGYWWAFSSYKPTELLTCSRVAHRGWGGVLSMRDGDLSGYL